MIIYYVPIVYASQFLVFFVIILLILKEIKKVRRADSLHY